MGSKLNFSPAQVKEVLDAHENRLMKFFNTTIKRQKRKVDNLTTENAVLKKEIADLKSSMQFHSDTNDKKLVEGDAKVSQFYVVNPIQKAPPSSISTVTSTNVQSSPHKYLTFSFYSFAKLV